MKKLFSVLVAVTMMFGLATSAMAAFQVEVKTNSEGVTFMKSACEKAGNITFIIDQNTTIKDGDWWTADLPLGVTLCKTIDFAILGSAGGVVPGPGGFLTTPGTANGTLDKGIWSIKDIDATNGVQGVTVTGTAFWFRVSGVNGSNRLRIEAYDSDDVAAGDNKGYAAPLNSNGSSQFTVQPGTEFQIKLFDQEAHNGVKIPGVWAVRDTDKYDANSLANGYRIYGEDASNNITGEMNSYCIQADPDVYNAQTVNVSINSGGTSGNNFLTFNPANPQVAHQISATSISLEKCKGDEYGLISLAGGQNAQCKFDYENPVGFGGYCKDIGSASFRPDPWLRLGGNKVIIKNETGTFYNNTDVFQIQMVTAGNGVYFGGTGSGINWYSPTNTTVCDVGSTPTGTIPVGWTPQNEVTTVPHDGTWASGIGCGTVAAKHQTRVLTTAKFTGIYQANRLEVNIPPIIFDASKVKSGDKVNVTINMIRMPCGKIFSATRTVAEFIDVCPASSPVTTLMFPYTTPLGAADWWFGMSFNNPVNAFQMSGTATVTVYEDDGDVGTYTTEAMKPGTTITWGGAGLLEKLTAAAGNAGTLGDARSHIVVECNFGYATGFGMMGNGLDSTGYTAYGANQKISDAKNSFANWDY